eukprot:12430156-Prorocentrum_lima.AAC.1
MRAHRPQKRQVWRLLRLSEWHSATFRVVESLEGGMVFQYAAMTMSAMATTLLWSPRRALSVV